MEVRLDSGAGRLELEPADEERLQSVLLGLRERGSFLVRLEEPLKLWTELEVTLRSGGREAVFAAQVIQVFRSGSDRHGTALQPVDPEVGERIAEEWSSGAADAPSVADAEEGSEEEPAANAPATREQPRRQRVVESESQGSSSAFRIRRLNLSERTRLATRAGRTERRLLLRDHSPQVLMALLANPRIEDKEVLELVKSPYAAGGVLKRVAGERRWTGSFDIRLALVRNPKTPTPIAVRLLPTLRKSDLQMLAKSAAVREAVRAPALRLYLKKI